MASTPHNGAVQLAPAQVEPFLRHRSPRAVLRVKNIAVEVAPGWCRRFAGMPRGTRSVSHTPPRVRPGRRAALRRGGTVRHAAARGRASGRSSSRCRRRTAWSGCVDSPLQPARATQGSAGPRDPRAARRPRHAPVRRRVAARRWAERATGATDREGPTRRAQQPVHSNRCGLRPVHAAPVSFEVDAAQHRVPGRAGPVEDSCGQPQRPGRRQNTTQRRPSARARRRRITGQAGEPYSTEHAASGRPPPKQ